MINKPPSKKSQESYWVANLTVVSILLAIWGMVAFVACIFLIGWLNQFKMGNVGFGFWMAQQGSILVFVALVLIYALAMDRIDRRFDQGE